MIFDVLMYCWRIVWWSFPAWCFGCGILAILYLAGVFE